MAASKSARQAGVRAGATLAQARALLPQLVARPRDEACERAAQEALVEVAEQFSPRVEDAGEGGSRAKEAKYLILKGSFGGDDRIRTDE